MLEDHQRGDRFRKSELSSLKVSEEKQGRTHFFTGCSVAFEREMSFPTRGASSRMVELDETPLTALLMIDQSEMLRTTRTEELRVVCPLLASEAKGRIDEIDELMTEFEEHGNFNTGGDNEVYRESLELLT
jgi:hypothetical protein